MMKSTNSNLVIFEFDLELVGKIKNARIMITTKRTNIIEGVIANLIISNNGI